MTGRDTRNCQMPASSEAYVIDRTEVFTLRDRVWGDDYRIVVAWPDGEMPQGGWPVLYLLDATSSFGTCVEALRRMSRRPAATGVEPLVVVGISAASGYDIARRQRDYTTPRAGAGHRGDAAAGEGGAEQFLDFIADDVRAAVAERLTLDPARQTLCGHSLAGYFALWGMMARPGLFRACAAISPSTWWDKAGLIDAAGQLSGQDCRMLLLFGEWEDALPPWQVSAPDSESVLARRKARAMVASGTDVAARLAEVLGEDRVRFLLLPEEDHVSIVSTAMPRVLRLASQA